VAATLVRPTTLALTQDGKAPPSSSSSIFFF